jgi:hypothetical protein
MKRTAHDAWGGGAVEEVKALQKSDPEARAQWVLYCDTFGEGLYDPNKHEESYITSFIKQFHEGARLDADDGLPQATKQLQRRSQEFRQAWSAFCATNGGGRNDPLKHPDDFHVQFYEVLARAALSSGMLAAPMGPPVASPAAGKGFGKNCGKGDWGPPPVVGKNPCGKGGGKPDWGAPPPWAAGPPVAAKGMAGKGMAAGKGAKGKVDASMDDSPHKQRLVASIKAYQRNPDQKQCWWDFCDQELAGVKDPNRHDIHTLQRFIRDYDVPDSGTGAPMASFDRPSFGAPTYSRAPIGQGATDPDKQHLVDRVKAYQRSSLENKEMWYSFCGDVKDPAKHEASDLEAFIDQFGVP